ncbi:hypothetical protein ONS95_009994 [Cadophora gregata]|uniref:uncharacterized protein n=1 Tax=Cadophora gregata TaxID=51156 RepID=UPI0026DD8802|nr:uncharacterized protein ONS95_009994 [Cadophora gregata]KAK0121709.1 hypothetical protein ONS95_009994 [Cadophora gregata]KAK0127185.1 hypothetical protein ONS96_006737 [Cadophora gregata f. sp. sojae]
MSSHTDYCTMSSVEDEAKTLNDSNGRSNTISSDVSILKPKNSFSCVIFPQPQLNTRPRGVMTDFAGLPTLKPSSSSLIPEEYKVSKMESSPCLSAPHQPPSRPKSCPIPLLTPPSANGNQKIIQSSSLNSSNIPSPSRLSRLSKAPPLEPYQFPLRQPQPDRSWLPAPTRSQPKPTYLKTARDRDQAIHGPLHPVTNLPCPPPSPNSQDLRLQRRFRAVPVEATSSSPLELVYDTRDKTFALERRSILLPGGNDTPMLEMQENLPPLLVDGRMTVVEVPRWSKHLRLFWRSFNGERSEVWRREVEFPLWVWMGRNFGDRWKECFVR